MGSCQRVGLGLASTGLFVATSRCKQAGQVAESLGCGRFKVYGILCESESLRAVAFATACCENLMHAAASTASRSTRKLLGRGLPERKPPKGPKGARRVG